MKVQEDFNKLKDPNKDDIYFSSLNDLFEKGNIELKAFITSLQINNSRIKSTITNWIEEVQSRNMMRLQEVQNY